MPHNLYYFLIIFFILFASTAIGQQRNNEGPIIEQFNKSLNLNETKTIDWSNESGWILNMTSIIEFNLTELQALNASARLTFPPLLMTTTRKPRQLPVGPKLYNDSEVESKWRIRMVHNLRWDLSKNFLAVTYLNLESQMMPDREGSVNDLISVIGSHNYPGSRMSFFYGIDQPNMLIRFNQTQNGAAFCEIGQLKGKSYPHTKDNGECVFRKNQAKLNDWKLKNCLYKRKPIYWNEENVPMKKQFYPFCPIPSADDGSDVFIWRLANGTSNPPSKTPHCIYDFHRKATEPEEYHLLKYCSKAYFFNGLDYKVSNKRMRNRRKDWILFLAEGQLKCSINGDTQTDMDLVGKGYKIELVHYSWPIQEDQLSKKCPTLKATLVQYKDNNKEGKFIIAAVIGAAQLDGDLRKPYEKEEARFWDKNTYNEKYKYMNFEDKSCYIFYQFFLRDWSTKRYPLQLEISHFCTEREMRGSLKFNVSIGPDQVPEEGIYEDTGIQIDLYKGQMRRSTGQIINARNNGITIIQGMNSTVIPEKQYLMKKHWWGIEIAPDSAVDSTPPLNKPAGFVNINDNETDGILPLNEKCNYTRECEYGSRCGDGRAQQYCEKISEAELDFSNPFLSQQARTGTYNCAEIYIANVRSALVGRIGEDLNYDATPHCKWANNNKEREGTGPDKRSINCEHDIVCRVDEFCALDNGECRKFRFQMHGEDCYVEADCLPSSKCVIDKGLDKWGHCENQNEFNQSAEEPNDPLD